MCVALFPTVQNSTVPQQWSPHSNEKGLFLVAKCIHENSILSVFRKSDDTLFGVVTASNTSFKVPLKGFPSTLKTTDLENAISTLSKSTLKWDGEAITLHVGLKGGGCCSSKPSREELLAAARECERQAGEVTKGDIKKMMAPGDINTAYNLYSKAAFYYQQLYGKENENYKRAFALVVELQMQKTLLGALGIEFN